MLYLTAKELEQVDALRKLDLESTTNIADFDAAVELAASVFGAPIALISLLEEDEQRFLSSVGMTCKSTPREVALCHHCVALGSTLIIEDALNDERFRDNPLVTCEGGIRAYLGHPISSPDGDLIGTLCVAFTEPREFTDKDCRDLVHLAATTSALINSHSRNLILQSKRERLEKMTRQTAQAERIGRIGSWQIDLKAQTLSWSDQVYAIHGLLPEKPVSVEEAVCFYPAHERPNVVQALADVVDHGGGFDFEAELIAVNGISKRIRAIGERFEDELGNPTHIVGVLQDISDAHAARAALRRAADFDSLTNLPNRNSFDRTLQHAIQNANDKQHGFALLLLDLDGFKEVNDIYGHLVGDMVLEEVAGRLLGLIPQGSSLARWGGDEFVIILPDTDDQADVYEVALAVVSALANDVPIGGDVAHIGATAGLVFYERGIGPKELLRRADRALYHGKKREPGTAHQYSPELEGEDEKRRDAIKIVRKALHDERVFPAFQPIVDLNSSKVVGMEALMRIVTKGGDRLTATQVLPALLDPILAREVGLHMLPRVCGSVNDLLNAYPDLEFVSINASEADLISHCFPENFLKTIAEAGIKPEKINLEVTETMLLVSDTALVSSVLKTLRDAGVTISLDDFGTGFSSLSHLRDFPIDKVKIDKSFVGQIELEHESRLIIQALVAMASNLKIDVVAEGVETLAQRDYLQGLGCQMAQGYLFGHAEDADRLILLSQRQNLKIA